MKTDLMQLRSKMAECNMTQEEVAHKIGVDPSTFSRKMKSDGLKFTVGQVHKLATVLGMTTEEAKNIFLR